MIKNVLFFLVLYKDMFVSKERVIVFLKEWFFKNIFFVLISDFI